MFEMIYRSKADGCKYATRLMTTDVNYAWRLAKHNVKNMNSFRNKGEQVELVTVQAC